MFVFTINDIIEVVILLLILGLFAMGAVLHFGSQALDWLGRKFKRSGRS